ncbi:MAG: cytochrome C oxidase subunit IV family protein [Bacteroidota bacterium]
MSHSHSSNHETVEGVIAPPQTKVIWRTFIILLIATCVEFAIAFGLPPEMKYTRISIFVVLTIFKAFYIVGEFMHLKHEVKSLIWMIIVPTGFIVWLLIALVYEGGHHPREIF